MAPRGGVRRVTMTERLRRRLVARRDQVVRQDGQLPDQGRRIAGRAGPLGSDRGPIGRHRHDGDRAELAGPRQTQVFLKEINHRGDALVRGRVGDRAREGSDIILHRAPLTHSLYPLTSASHCLSFRATEGG
jgi:hypothetical protein